MYDCKNVYFVPFLADGSKTFHSETLRYDTEGNFQGKDAWSAYNPVTSGSWNIPQGYDGAVFDGRYIYFAPTHDNVNHGTVLRYDTWIGTPDAQGNGVPDSCESNSPIIVSSPVTAVVVGFEYIYDVDATAQNAGDTLTFTLDTAPAGMTINSDTGLTKWTPALSQVGNHPVSIHVQNQNGFSNTQSFTVTVTTPGNRPPTITSTPVTTANTGELYSYDVNATDPDAGDVLTYSLTTAPAGMSIDTDTGLIQWTPAPAQAGNPSVTVKVQDQGGLSATQSFTIAVSQTNHAPVISSTPPAGVKAEKLYSYARRRHRPDAGDALTYTFASGIPSGMSIDAASGLLQWTPTAAQVGTHSGIIIKVSDQKGLFATQTIDITVKPANRAPSHRFVRAHGRHRKRALYLCRAGQRPRRGRYARLQPAHRPRRHDHQSKHRAYQLDAGLCTDRRTSGHRAGAGSGRLEGHAGLYGDCRGRQRHCARCGGRNPGGCASRVDRLPNSSRATC